MHRPSRPAEAGFTLIEVLLTVSLLAIVSMASVAVLSDTLDEQKFTTTVQTLKKLRAGLVGQWTTPALRTGNGLGMPLNSGWTPQSASLIALWHLDETAGTSLKDSSGAGNAATRVGSTSLNEPARVKTGLKSAGAGGISAALDLSAVTRVTIAAWVDYGGCTDPDRCVLWEFSSDYTAGAGFIVSASDSSGGAIPAGSMSFGQNTLNGTQIEYAAALTAGWHHVAVVYDRSNGTANTITAYLDGAPLATTSASSHSGSDPFGSSTLYLLGRNATTYPTAATLDEVAVWSTSLSAAEIAGIYSRQVRGYRARPRESFGYLGDVGALPTAGQGLAALWTNPGIPAWELKTDSRIGIGWNGPYVATTFFGASETKDAWGTDIAYDPAANPPTLTSLGADRAAGGTGLNQDIVVQIPTAMIQGSIQGLIWNDGNPWDGNAEIELNVPDGSGAPTQVRQTIATGAKGVFSFSNVPLGVRSITIYSPSKAAATKTAGPYVIMVDRPENAITIQASGL